MKVSIITVCFNSSKTILDTIKSVNDQTYKSIEHIFIDSNSIDDTLEIIQNNSTRDLKIISEPDKGIYEAMNKGVRIATGDFICFLNSDDFYANKYVIETVAKYFSLQDIDTVYGNIDYVSEENIYKRTFKAPNNFKKVLSGYQIPHPAFFLKTSILKNMDYPFDPCLKIASDIGQQIYLASNYEIKARKINGSLVMMRTGGISGNFFNRIIGWLETAKVFNQITKRNGMIFLVRKILNNVLSAFI